MTEYIKRNRRWIKPALVGMMLATAAMMVRMIELKAGVSQIPAWIAPLGIVVAGFGAGFGAMFTDTTSAYVVRLVGTAAGLAAFLQSVFK